MGRVHAIDDACRAFQQHQQQAGGPKRDGGIAPFAAHRQQQRNEQGHREEIRQQKIIHGHRSEGLRFAYQPPLHAGLCVILCRDYLNCKRRVQDS